MLPLLILVVALAFAARTTDSFAFSFEGIDIQTKFGERFRAELDVLLEEDGDFLAQIGDLEDYKRLELERPKIIDDFTRARHIVVSAMRLCEPNSRLKFLSVPRVFSR